MTGANEGREGPATGGSGVLARARRALPLAGAAVFPVAAGAADLSSLSLDAIHQNGGVAGASIFLGLVLITTITALLHLTGRARWARRDALMAAELAETRAQLDRAQVFLAAEPQIVIAWGGGDGEPDIAGDIALVAEPSAPRRVLGFGSWLAAPVAQELDRAVDRLRARGEGFRMALVSLAGRHIEADGRAIGGRAILRIRDVSGDRLELAGLRERHAKILNEVEAFRGLLDALPSPAWLRDRDGDIVWVNAAYARAVEAATPQDAAQRRLELLDQTTRRAAEAARSQPGVWRQRVFAVVAGERRLLDIVESTSPHGVVGLASDLSEIEAARGQLERRTESHQRTLDLLSMAVAIFDSRKRLVFSNAAYRHLWGLEPGFLEQNPTDSEILDRLRAARKLPEQADFRAWKRALMDAYQSTETGQQAWHLPNGRTLRVVTHPSSEGGVTYLFEDVTQRFALESQFNALTRVQGETLNSLQEGVAVFGTDGRLKLANPALAAIWRLSEPEIAGNPHVDVFLAACARTTEDGATLDDMRALVAGLPEERTGFERRLARRDGGVVDCRAAPLPDGATLLTFADVTAAVSVERALTERNAALTEAAKLRDDFVHHVSYELRSPLTHIIGFSELLGDAGVGPLNQRQREYAGYIRKSSAALLAIINDILDLASIDVEAVKLSVAPVDIRKTIAAAAEGVQDRLEEANLRLNVVAMDDLGVFVADGKRVRQILFNLLSNAIGFSSPGKTVSLAALRRGDDIVFKVSDEGRGIPADVLERVFERFESHTIGSRHRGVGLGLSIVRSFVELHGGRVLIDSAPGAGTTVTCIFPASPADDDAAQPAARAPAPPPPSESLPAPAAQPHA